jgi:deoxyribose-phosphate aldolase
MDKLIEQIADEVRRKLGTGYGGAGPSTSRAEAPSSSNADVAAMIEHTVLRADSTEEQVVRACREAKEHRFALVCVLPAFVSKAVEQLRGSGINVGTVAGFPLGAASTAAKVAEVREALMNGAREVDVAMNFAAIKSDKLDEAKKDLEAVVSAARGSATIKAIVEFPLLTEEERVKALTIAKLAGADSVKLSATSGSGVCSAADVAFARKVVGPSMGIKADGGIKDLARARELVSAGANRLGASGSVAIVTGCAGSTAVSDKVTPRDIAQMIDHSLLRPELTREQVLEGCRLAREYEAATVCVKPCDVAAAKAELRGSSVLTTTVIGFPHGSPKTEIKVQEAIEAMNDGAVELDVVLNIGRLLGKEFDYVEKDLEAVVKAAHTRGVIVKVILENCYLTDELKVKACQICEKVGADFVKTSTGYGTGGATIADLKLMRKTVSPKVRVKAAGGVRTLEHALSVRAVGTVRFGATATKAIMEEARKREKEGTLRMIEPVELKSGY